MASHRLKLLIQSQAKYNPAGCYFQSPTQLFSLSDTVLQPEPPFVSVNSLLMAIPSGFSLIHAYLDAFP